MGTRVPRDHLNIVEEVMEEFGVINWDIEKGRKHPILVFSFSGRTFKYPLASTPSDRRSVLNCRADLRRMCRLQRADHGCRVSS